MGDIGAQEVNSEVNLLHLQDSALQISSIVVGSIEMAVTWRQWEHSCLHGGSTKCQTMMMMMQLEC